jgi:hypothetical protein
MWGRGPDLYLPVLLKEMCQIWHKIPDDVHVGQGADLCDLPPQLDTRSAGKAVDST